MLFLNHGGITGAVGHRANEKLPQRLKGKDRGPVLSLASHTTVQVSRLPGIRAGGEL